MSIKDMMSILFSVLRYFIGGITVYMLYQYELQWSHMPDIVWMSLALTALLTVLPDIAYRLERCNFETEENSEGTSETEKPMPERIEIYVAIKQDKVPDCESKNQSDNQQT